MQKTEIRKAETRQKEPITVEGFLLSALDMEDEIAHSIYRHYLERENWPENLKDDIFEEIRKYLTTLLDDTERHRNIVRNLQSKLGQNNG